MIGLTIALIVAASGIAWCQDTKPAPMPTTVEVCMTYDILPGVDKKAWAEFAKFSVATYMKAPGLIEWRANRNLLGSPQVRITNVWQSFGDLAKFRQSEEWAAVETQLRTFVTNIRVEMWGTSPLVPKPVRPGK